MELGYVKRLIVVWIFSYVMESMGAEEFSQFYLPRCCYPTHEKISMRYNGVQSNKISKVYYENNRTRSEKEDDLKIRVVRDKKSDEQEMRNKTRVTTLASSSESQDSSDQGVHSLYRNETNDPFEHKIDARNAKLLNESFVQENTGEPSSRKNDADDGAASQKHSVRYKDRQDWKIKLKRALFKSMAKRWGLQGRDRWGQMENADITIVEGNEFIPTKELNNVLLPLGYGPLASGMLINSENGIEIRIAAQLTFPKIGGNQENAGKCICNLIRNGEFPLAYWTIRRVKRDEGLNALQYIVYAVPQPVPNPPQMEHFNNMKMHFRPSQQDLLFRRPENIQLTQPSPFTLDLRQQPGFNQRFHLPGVNFDQNAYTGIVPRGVKKADHTETPESYVQLPKEQFRDFINNGYSPEQEWRWKNQHPLKRPYYPHKENFLVQQSKFRFPQPPKDPLRFFEHSNKPVFKDAYSTTSSLSSPKQEYTYKSIPITQVWNEARIGTLKNKHHKSNYFPNGQHQRYTLSLFKPKFDRYNDKYRSRNLQFLQSYKEKLRNYFRRQQQPGGTSSEHFVGKESLQNGNVKAIEMMPLEPLDHEDGYYEPHNNFPSYDINSIKNNEQVRFIQGSSHSNDHGKQMRLAKNLGVELFGKNLFPKITPNNVEGGNAREEKAPVANKNFTWQIAFSPNDFMEQVKIPISMQSTKPNDVDFHHQTYINMTPRIQGVISESDNDHYTPQNLGIASQKSYRNETLPVAEPDGGKNVAKNSFDNPTSKEKPSVTSNNHISTKDFPNSILEILSPAENDMEEEKRRLFSFPPPQSLVKKPRAPQSVHRTYYYKDKIFTPIRRSYKLNDDLRRYNYNKKQYILNF